MKKSSLSAFAPITGRIGLYLHPTKHLIGDRRVVSTDSKPLISGIGLVFPRYCPYPHSTTFVVAAGMEFTVIANLFL